MRCTFKNRTEITRAISNSFPTQTRQSYYYEKRFPILYISEYYIYRINFRQRGCNLDARNVISTKPRGPSIWAHAVVSTQVALHRPGLPYQHDEHELATIRSAAAEFLRLRGRTSESQMPSGTVKRASSSSFRRCARRRQTCRESGLDQRADSLHGLHI